MKTPEEWQAERRAAQLSTLDIDAARARFDAALAATEPDPQIERELQHELAERDREWWA